MRLYKQHCLLGWTCEHRMPVAPPSLGRLCSDMYPLRRIPHIRREAAPQNSSLKVDADAERKSRTPQEMAAEAAELRTLF